jgi:CRP-like cAMP-binding protein
MPTYTDVSQDTLAEMAGTTRARVAVLMTTFQKSGFIEYNGGLTINRSLLSVVLRD